MSWTPEQIETTLRAVTERSMTDPGFRALALSNPVGAIGKVASVPVPNDFKIQFVDNAGCDMTVVLPDAAKQGAPVTEEELASVAGGGYGLGGVAVAAHPDWHTITVCVPAAANPAYTKKPGNAAFCANG